MLSGRGLCDKLITRPEESYRLCCVVVCDLETSRMGAAYIYDVSRLRVKQIFKLGTLYIYIYGQMAGTCGYGEGLSASINAGNFLTSWKVSFSRRTLLHGVSK